MSYHCAECNAVHYGKRLSVIKSIKNVDYVRLKVYFDRQEKKHKSAFDNKFTGWEIDSQVDVCEKCFEEQKDSTPSIVNEQKIVNFFIKNDSNRNFNMSEDSDVNERPTRHNRATKKHRKSNRDNIYEDGV